jgi:hypothetical protein
MSGCGPLGSGSGSGSGSSSETDLIVTVWPQGPGGPSRVWTLRCDPADGSLPQAAKACSRVTAASLRPLARDMICTQIYGGPQTARVRGRIDGSRVDSRFARNNGCEIHRWDSVRFLFPVRI